MPPDTPEERITTVEQAVKEIIESDAMQQWSEDTGRGVAFGSRDEMRSVWQGGFENIREKIDLEQFREETS